MYPPAMADKEEGTCSVCLRRMQLKGERPIRHGFNAIGVRHGAHTGFHTGPCPGIEYPHLGLSDAGTRWARGREEERRKITQRRLDELAGKPPLTWYPQKREGRVRVPDLKNGIEVRPGDNDQYRSIDDNGIGYSQRVPTYDALWKSRKAEVDAIMNACETAIAAYDKVITNYDPAKYPVTGAVSKDVIHLEKDRKHPRFGEWKGIACKLTRPGPASMRPKKTTDPSKVTCKPCRKLLGLT